MKFLHHCLVWGALATLTASCSQDAPWTAATGEQGKISLKLKTDLTVSTSTRANDSESPVKPDGERFKIRLENADGSYVKEWENLGKFNDEEGFPRGAYTVTAYYGSENEQGFTKPYYVGTEQINVVPGETSSHSVTTTLANSMVSIRYTDSFLSYFSSFSASLKADGIATPVAFARNETRPAYVKSGKVGVKFNISSPDGQEVVVEPAEFTAQPRHHYIITANVKGTENNGTSVLEVLFEENVVKETQEIILSDDLFTSAAPEISVHGFTVDSLIETFESVDIDNTPEFHIVAFGGIKEARFTVELVEVDGKLNGTLPAFNGSVDLASADLTTQELIKQSGLKCFGFFKTPEENKETGNKMAVIEMKDFIENLDPGNYKISLSVKDALGRVNPAVTRTRAEDGTVEENPVSFYVKINRIDFELKEDVKPVFMSNELSVIVTTNYEGARDEFKFMTDDRNGHPQDAKIILVKSVESSSPDTYSYRFTLSTDNIDDTDWNVYALYPKKDTKTITLWAEVPGYKIETDPFATKLMLKVIPDDPKNLGWMTEKVKLYFASNGKNNVLLEGLSRDSETGIITIENTVDEKRFEPGKEYKNFYATFGNNYDYHNQQIVFTTEDASPVPNGDFEDLVPTINATINQGGKWARTVLGQTHTTTLSMKVSEPRYWYSSNSQTCNLNASNLNSWFTIPSVYNTSLTWNANQPKIDVLQDAHSTTPAIYSDNLNVPKESNAMVIRNVAWDLNGHVDDDKGTYGVKDYYCHNIPNISNRTRGSLILGDGITEGKEFSSRPSSLKGQYKYIQDVEDRNESGLIIIKILSGKDIIGYGELLLYAEDNYTTFECPISYIPNIYMRKASSIQISIFSSNKESDIKTTNYCNKDECCSRGASLFIDALEFGY